MCYKVNYYPDIACVSINGIDYTQAELEQKQKTKMENSILHTLKEIILDEEIKVLHIDVEFDDISELVKSDQFKGDNHSSDLVA